MGDEATSVAAPAAASSNSSFTHDVFVSYSHEDGQWVLNQFVTELRSAGLKVLTDAEFEIGRPSVENMTNAVRDSRHIVAVLTPRWVNSQWTAFEGYLVTTADPVGRQRRLLPLMLELCKPPPHLAFLTYADFTDPTRRPQEMQRLLRAMQTQAELHDALPVRTTYASEYARDGLTALVDLMQQPGVHDTVVGFKTVFRDTRRQAEVVYNYKDLHDQLHEIQLRCYNRVLREKQGFPDDALAVESLMDCKLTLESTIGALHEIVARADYLANEGAGVQLLEQAHETFDDALQRLDKDLLGKAAQKLARVLSLQPSRINAKLAAAAGNLHLEDLVEAMRVISDRLTELHADEKQLQQFTNGMLGLKALHSALLTLISEHDLWQQVDNRLHLIESDLDADLDSLAESWNEVHQIAAPLYEKKLEPWAETYSKLEASLLTAIANRNPAQAKTNFRLCRSRALDRFYQVDVTLKRSCENLRKIGEPLAAVLDNI